MQCPKCFKSDTTFIVDHYVCNNPTCFDSNGHKTQFSIETDKKICFPYNEIFITRNRNEFYKKPYLKTE